MTKIVKDCVKHGKNTPHNCVVANGALGYVCAQCKAENEEV